MDSAAHLANLATHVTAGVAGIGLGAATLALALAKGDTTHRRRRRPRGDRSPGRMTLHR